jgi:hypothetical protein
MKLAALALLALVSTSSAQAAYCVAYPTRYTGTRVKALPGWGASAAEAERACQMANATGFGSSCRASCR